MNHVLYPNLFEDPSSLKTYDTNRPICTHPVKVESKRSIEKIVFSVKQQCPAASVFIMYVSWLGQPWILCLPFTCTGTWSFNGWSLFELMIKLLSFVFWDNRPENVSHWSTRPTNQCGTPDVTGANKSEESSTDACYKTTTTCETVHGRPKV